jgi:hypothetical protein
VRSAQTNTKLAALLPQWEREGFRPEALRALVSEEEARMRWRGLAAFYGANGHFLVTNGPYKLKSWTPQSVTLEAFRDLTYPLGVGSYDAYAVPRRGFITRTEWEGDRLILSAEIEVVEKFQRNYRLVRMPLKSMPATELKRATPECRYLVTDADGRVVLTGVAAPAAEARFSVELGQGLPAGRYVLSAQIAVNGNVMNANIRRIEFSVPPRQ